MILINQQETKKVYFNLTPVITNPQYLFRFLSNDTGEETLFFSENNSVHSHYQSFTFSEGVVATFSGGFITIPGTYDYQIYQMSSTQSLNIASASAILEVGLVTVLGGTGSCYIWKEESYDDYVYYEPCAPAPPGLTGN